MGYAQPDHSAKGVLEEISGIVPFFKGITWEELGKDGLQWPVDEDSIETPVLHKGTFKRGRGVFHKQTYRQSSELQEHANDYPFILTTNRQLEHYNSGAMTRRTPNRELVSGDMLLINPYDAGKHAIENGDMVCVESIRGKTDIRARISTAVTQGVLSTTFHFPDAMVNDITSDVYDNDSMCPEYKVVAVRIRKSKGRYKTEK